MKTYTNVVFDREEQGVLRRASLHLSVAFPRMHEEMPKRASDRLEDHNARVVLQLIRDSTTGTFDNLARAEAVLAKLTRTLTEQSTMDYWIAEHDEFRRTRPEVPALEPVDEPTSAYQQYLTLADIRAGQLVDARHALKMLQRASRLARPIGEVE